MHPIALILIRFNNNSNKLKRLTPYFKVVVEEQLPYVLAAVITLLTYFIYN